MALVEPSGGFSRVSVDHPLSILPRPVVGLSPSWKAMSRILKLRDLNKRAGDLKLKRSELSKTYVLLLLYEVSNEPRELPSAQMSIMLHPESHARLL